MNNLNKFKKYRVKIGNILKVIDRKKKGEAENRKKIKKPNLRSKKKKNTSVKVLETKRNEL